MTSSKEKVVKFQFDVWIIYQNLSALSVVVNTKKPQIALEFKELARLTIGGL